MVWQVPHERLGQAGVVRTPLMLNGLTPGVSRPVPGLGEHADEVLAEAGLSRDEIETLRASGALGNSE
jgi:formyl-CoA transferase